MPFSSIGASFYYNFYELVELKAKIRKRLKTKNKVP